MGTAFRTALGAAFGTALGAALGRHWGGIGKALGRHWGRVVIVVVVILRLLSPHPRHPSFVSTVCPLPGRRRHTAPSLAPITAIPSSWLQSVPPLLVVVVGGYKLWPATENSEISY